MTEVRGLDEPTHSHRGCDLQLEGKLHWRTQSLAPTHLLSVSLSPPWCPYPLLDSLVVTKEPFAPLLFARALARRTSYLNCRTRGGL